MVHQLERRWCCLSMICEPGILEQRDIGCINLVGRCIICGIVLYRRCSMCVLRAYTIIHHIALAGTCLRKSTTALSHLLSCQNPSFLQCTPQCSSPVPERTPSFSARLRQWHDHGGWYNRPAVCTYTIHNIRSTHMYAS